MSNSDLRVARWWFKNNRYFTQTESSNLHYRNIIQITVMALGLLRVPVMRYTPTRDPTGDPRPKHSLDATAKGAATATVSIPLLVVAVLHPVAAVASVGLVLATWPLVDGFRRLSRDRKRRERTASDSASRPDACCDV